MKQVALTAILIATLTGCATPSIPKGNSIQDFSRELKQQSFTYFPPKYAPDSFFGMQGLRELLMPTIEHCKTAGGVAVGTTGRFPPYPSRFATQVRCKKDGTTIWALKLQYSNLSAPFSVVDGKTQLLKFNVTSDLVDLSNGANTLANMDQIEEEQRIKREKEKADWEAGAPERARKAAEDRQLAEEQRARQAAVLRDAQERRAKALLTFQSALKVGDRVTWLTEQTKAFVPVGMIVQVNGAVVLVQFDNLTVQNSSTRWINRNELAPLGL